jgi:hypothetical protein
MLYFKSLTNSFQNHLLKFKGMHEPCSSFNRWSHSLAQGHIVALELRTKNLTIWNLGFSTYISKGLNIWLIFLSRKSAWDNYKKMMMDRNNDMYIWVTCLYIWIICLYIHIYRYMDNICMYVCIYLCVHIWLTFLSHIYLYIHMFVEKLEQFESPKICSWLNQWWYNQW